ncbi:gamma-glutamylaminecyclotransferase C-like isoform X2 [Apostichopus japonicus]|uniref:gamma-glutamylaminecyclotransferase C-like isoform X2 n=1 Tax=Stichopus japonicus TaxID=307972 RepID=UPI003AB2095B
MYGPFTYFLDSQMSAGKLHRVFLYGTLKKGQPNHAVMTDPSNGQATFVCCANTVSKYPLVIATSANIPSVLFQDEGLGNNIFGEIWEVDGKMRQTLDDFEGFPEYYGRHQIPVVTVPNKDSDGKASNDSVVAKEETCWIYTIREYDKRLVESKFFSNYDSYGDHGLPYCAESYFQQRDQKCE